MAFFDNILLFSFCIKFIILLYSFIIINSVYSIKFINENSNYFSSDFNKHEHKISPSLFHSKVVNGMGLSIQFALKESFLSFVHLHLNANELLFRGLWCVYQKL